MTFSGLSTKLSPKTSQVCKVDKYLQILLKWKTRERKKEGYYDSRKKNVLPTKKGKSNDG